MKRKTKELLQLIKETKYKKAYSYYVKHNTIKYKHIEWYAEDWAKAFVSCPVEDTINFPERREVYR